MSHWYDTPHFYKEANDCGCPTKYWKAFHMDYISVPLYNEYVNAALSIPFMIGSFAVFGDLSGGTPFTHDAVIIYFKCLKCGSTFSCTFDLVKSGTRKRFGYFETNCLAKYHQTKLWLARDEMKSIVDLFTFGPKKYDNIFYNCSHFANQFYNAICRLDENSKCCKWSKILGYCVSPNNYMYSDCFVHKDICSCSSEKWKSYQMDLNTAMIFDESKKKGLLGTYATDIDVLTLHFKCSECQKEFKTSFYYYEKICRKNGYFRRILTTNDPISFEIPHDSLKPILDVLAAKKQIYTSEEYARDLFNSLFEVPADKNIFQSSESLVF